jgi:hypothetical protein
MICQCSAYETPDPRRTLKRMITSPKKTERNDAWMWIWGESKSELRARPPAKESERNLISNF